MPHRIGYVFKGRAHTHITRLRNGAISGHIIIISGHCIVSPGLFITVFTGYYVGLTLGRGLSGGYMMRLAGRGIVDPVDSAISQRCFHIVNPILMPKHHHLTRLIIYYAHCTSRHMGLQSTLNFLRMHGFWILKARQAVLSVIKECVVCKRYNVPSVKYPSPASLPATRVNLNVPFTHTGVDYTGHIWIKDRSSVKVKIYILIFTCFNTRAIHLEALDSMSTAEFILAFVQFVNKYGIPSAVYSDNAKPFVQAGNIIEHLLLTYCFHCTSYHSCLCCLVSGYLGKVD